MPSTTNILDLNNRIDALEKFAHNVEPIQQQIDELKSWTDPGTKDASGNPIILTDGAAFKAEGLVVTLEPIQSGSGTPSPTNVRPITGLTECVVDVKDEDDTTQATAIITFGQTVYGGTVNFKTGKVSVTHGIVDFGTLAWSIQPTRVTGKNRFRTGAMISIIKPAPQNNVIANIISSDYKAITAENTYSLYDGDGIGVDTNGAILIYDSTRDTLTGEQFKTAMDGVQLCYELATPTELTLTPAELELLKGYNYITTNGTNIELTYQPDNLKADIMLTVSQLYGSKISIFDGILTGGDTGQVLTKTSDDNYDATWATLPATRTTTRKTTKEEK